MGISGNFAAMEDLQRRVAALARKDSWRAELAQRMGAAALKQVADEFREGRDPYGKPWLPPKHRPGDKPLLDTGRMRSSATAQPYGGGFRLSITAKYAAVHQYGGEVRKPRTVSARYQALGAGGRFARNRRGSVKDARAAMLDGQAPATPIRFLPARSSFRPYRIPQRQMIPMPETGGLGARWTLAFNKEAARMINEKMGVK